MISQRLPQTIVCQIKLWDDDSSMKHGRCSAYRPLGFYKNLCYIFLRSFPDEIAQFAKAAGARVIATTSSDSKAQILKKLGADHVINYKTEPDWGSAAAKLTPDGLGVNHVIEIGGAQTMAQSLKAIKVDGCISLIGFVGGPPTAQQPTFLECLSNGCIVRGVHVGSRMMFEDMNRAIDATGIKPVVDYEVFALEDVRKAYQFMASHNSSNPSSTSPYIVVLISGQWDQKHIGKVTIRI